MPKVVLHQWDMSPFCNKVRRCLKYKGVDYSIVNYNGLAATQASKLSPVGKLPVLDWDGERIQDSAAIARFLDAKIPGKPLYPVGDPQALAAARMWEDWAGQSLYFYEIYFRMLDPVSLERALDLVTEGRPRYERSILKFVFKRRYPRKLKEQGLARLPKEEVERLLFERLEDIEFTLEGRTFLAGLAPSIGDFSVAAQIDELIRTSDLRERILSYKGVKAWLARC
jgi:glutathione S-transferase